MTRLTVQLKFLNGHYHATPWHHQANEGLVEWPPSPWRLSRALIATAFTKLLPQELNEEVLSSLVTRLASTPPSYHLPAITEGHSRHYVPASFQDRGKRLESPYKTTLLIDSYALIKEPLYISWELELSSQERALAEQLFPRLSYLGRAESWVEATVLPSDAPLPKAPNCVLDEGGPLLKDEQLIEVLASQRPDEYERWCAQFRAQAEEEAKTQALRRVPGPTEEAPSDEQLKKQLKRQNTAVKQALKRAADILDQQLPPSLFTCLTVESAWLKEQGWSEAPGTKRRLYRVQQVSAVKPPRAQSRRVTNSHVEAMLISLNTEHRESVHVPLTQAVDLGERYHRALVKQAALGERINHEVLVGRTVEGGPVYGHQHLHIIPITMARATHIDHVLLWSPVGLDAAAQRAIRSVKALYGHQKLTLHVVGEGSRANLARVLSSGAGASLLEASTVWESWTPFVAPKFLKERGKKRLEAQLIDELKIRGLIEDESEVTVTRLSAEDQAGARFSQFKLRRSKSSPQPPMSFGFGVRLTFKKPVLGPLTLGYASHFGLGVFKAGRLDR